MTLSQKLLNNINSLYVSQNTTRDIILTETKKSYSVNIRISGDNDVILIKNIEDLKQNHLPYSSGKFMPKDCDYILIRNIFYRVEIRATKKIQTEKKRYNYTIMCRRRMG